MCLGLLVLGFLPTACSMHSRTTVSRSETGQIQHFRTGVILSLHEVDVVGEQSGVGVGAGAVAGGLAGSKISEDKVTSAIGAIWGGSPLNLWCNLTVACRLLSRKRMMKIWGVEERVLILESETTRIIRDQTSKN
jgi:hypothetical protein